MYIKLPLIATLVKPNMSKNKSLKCVNILEIPALFWTHWSWWTLVGGRFPESNKLMLHSRLEQTSPDKRANGCRIQRERVPDVGIKSSVFSSEPRRASLPSDIHGPAPGDLRKREPSSDVSSGALEGHGSAHAHSAPLCPGCATCLTQT